MTPEQPEGTKPNRARVGAEPEAKTDKALPPEREQNEGTPTKEKLLHEQELSTERQHRGTGWSSQSLEEPSKAHVSPEPLEASERAPVRSTARLEEEGQRIEKRREPPT